MNYPFIIGGCVLGGALGNIIGKMFQPQQPKPQQPKPQQQPHPQQQQPMPQPDIELEAPPLPEEIANNMEKICLLSSPQGRAICASFLEICREISVVSTIIAYESDESNPELKKMVTRGCSKLAEARLLLDKLCTVERLRAGKLEEFVIYRTTVQSELDGIGSSFNNYLTKHIMDV